MSDVIIIHRSTLEAIVCALGIVIFSIAAMAQLYKTRNEFLSTHATYSSVADECAVFAIFGGLCSFFGLFLLKALSVALVSDFQMVLFPTLIGVILFLATVYFYDKKLKNKGGIQT